MVLALILFWVFINLDFDSIYKNTQKKGKANISLSWPNKFGHQLHVWCQLKVIAAMADNIRLKENKDRQKVILTELPRGDFVWGEGVAVRTVCTLLGDFRTKKNEYHF